MSDIKNAIISVSDKTGLIDFVEKLQKRGLRIYSTRGTNKHLSEKYAIEVESLESITHLPELLGGRVKTLDSQLYAGILARDTVADRNDLIDHNLMKFDVIVCNLYPFQEMYEKTGNLKESIESIDIGGVTLLRAAAKNSDRVLVICDPTVLNGNPSYINVLDALNAWQLVKAIRKILGRPAAACFKHVSPAGVAIGNDFSETELKAFFVDRKRVPNLSELAKAFIRARNGDSLSAYGDFIALSHTCDLSTASLIEREVSDGVIAPGFEPAALATLKAKKNGNYVIIEIDIDYEPDRSEARTVYGINLVQDRNDFVPNKNDLEKGIICGKTIDHNDFVDIVIGTIALKYTQSNSVCFVKNGQVIGIAAGQQSRLHATKLAANKAKNWWMRQHELILSLPFRSNFKRFEKNNAIDYFLSGMISNDEWHTFFKSQPPQLTSPMRTDHLEKLTGVSYVSDACLPFCDNIEVANECRLKNVVAPMGSKNDSQIIEKCQQLNLTLIDLKHRLFHH